MSSNTKQLKDEEIIQGILTDGTQAERTLNYLFDAYRSWVPGFCKKYGQPEEEVLSAYLDALLSVFNQIKNKQFRGEAMLSTYLYRIFKNKCVDAIRKNSTYQKRHVNKLNFTDVEDHSESLLKAILNKEEVQRIKKQLELLSEFCRKFLTDAIFKEYQSSELMEKYQLENARQIRNRKYKCLNNLRKLI